MTSLDIEAILETAEEQLARCGPVEAEVLASGALGLAYEPGVLGAETDMLTAIADQVAANPTPGTLALLLALARVCDPSADEAVLPVARRLSATGVATPAWTGAIENVAVEEAWIGADAHGDHEVAVGIFRHPGYPAHALQVMVDKNLGGAILDAAVLLEPGSLLEHWRRQVPLRPLHPGQLSQMLIRGMAATDERLQIAPASPDYRQTRGVVRARIRDLPPPAPQVPKLDARSRENLVQAFLASEEAQGIDPPVSLVETMFEFRIDHGDGDALRWSPILVGMYMGAWFPSRVLADEQDIAALPETLRALVRFGGHQRGLAPRIVAEAAESVAEFEAEFQRACRDVALFTPVKRLHVQMVAEGVPAGDDAAVAAWITRFNERPEQARRAVLDGDTG